MIRTPFTDKHFGNVGDVDVSGAITDDIIRYNAITGYWEKKVQPFAFTQITLTPRSAFVSAVEGGIFYDSDDDHLYVGTEA